jgi:hypothetical protein
MDFAQINKFINTGINKLKLANGEIYKLRYISAEIVTGKYGEQMQLEFVDIADGKKKKFYTTSKILLTQMFQKLKIREGEEIYLSKHGDRFETVYDCRRVNQKTPSENKN